MLSIFSSWGNSNHQDLYAIQAIAPEVPKTNAEAYLLMDFDTQQILAEKNMSKRLPPASLTKLMTAYVVEAMLKTERIKPTDLVPISEKAWKTPGSTMFLKVKEMIAVSELMKGFVVVSGNDAGIALAEYIAGNEAMFVTMMNKAAEGLGLNNSHFEDVNGLSLPDNHYSSAKDLAYLSFRIIKDFPENYPLYSIKSYQHGRDHKTGELLNPQPNRLRLLLSPEWKVDGLKTGYTKDAGYCQAVSAVKNNARRIVVVLNAGSSDQRDQDTQSLLRYSYQFFDNVNVLTKDKQYSIPILKGEKNTINVSTKDDVWATMMKGHANIKTELKVPQPLQAPIFEGQQLGEISVISSAGKILQTVPVFATEAVKIGNFFKRAWDFLRTLF